MHLCFTLSGVMNNATFNVADNCNINKKTKKWDLTENLAPDHLGLCSTQLLVCIDCDMPKAGSELIQPA